MARPDQQMDGPDAILFIVLVLGRREHKLELSIGLGVVVVLVEYLAKVPVIASTNPLLVPVAPVGTLSLPPIQSRCDLVVVAAVVHKDDGEYQVDLVVGPGDALSIGDGQGLLGGGQPIQYVVEVAVCAFLDFGHAHSYAPPDVLRGFLQNPPGCRVQFTCVAIDQGESVLALRAGVSIDVATPPDLASGEAIRVVSQRELKKGNGNAKKAPPKMGLLHFNIYLILQKNNSLSAAKSWQSFVPVASTHIPLFNNNELGEFSNFGTLRND